MIDDVPTIISSTKDGLSIMACEKISNQIILPAKTLVYRGFELGTELVSQHEGLLTNLTEIILREDTWICKSGSSNIMKVSECVAKIDFSK
jgi:hypothetical protein